MLLFFALNVEGGEEEAPTGGGYRMLRGLGVILAMVLRG